MTGLSTSYVNNLKNGMSDATILKIQDAFPELNMEWLLEGKDENMLQDVPNERFVNSPMAQASIHGKNRIYVSGYSAPKEEAYYMQLEMEKMSFEIEHLKEMLTEKDKLLAEKNKALADKNNIIEDKERMIRLLMESKQAREEEEEA